MRTTKITINGREYPLCYSVRAMRSIIERFGDIQTMIDAMTKGDQIKMADTTVWVASVLIDAGARYARLNGMEAPEPLDENSLNDICNMADYANIRAKVMEALTLGIKADVEVKQGKNAEATQNQ